MYLSRVRLDTTRRGTMKALASPNLFHGAIERAFPGGRERNLWRVDTVGGATWLLILSPQRPDLSGVAAQFGAEGQIDAWETKDYEPLLRRTTEGSCWHFRLTANPTISRAPDGDARGKVYGHITTAFQEKWLMDRAEKHGFQIEDSGFMVVGSRWLHFRKGTDGGRPVTLMAATYEGTLTVTDAALFRGVLTDGLGRGKAYGLGMMTVAGMREQANG